MDNKVLSLFRIIVFFVILCSGYYALFFNGVSTNSNSNSETQLTELQISLNKTSKDLKATSWSKGGFRMKNSNSWVLNGAYFELPECINYENFNEILSQNGFIKDPVHGAYYCKNDIVLFGSFDNNSSDATAEQGSYCKKVIFNIKWESGQNRESPYCWGAKNL